MLATVQQMARWASILKDHKKTHQTMPRSDLAYNEAENQIYSVKWIVQKLHSLAFWLREEYAACLITSGK